MNASHWTVRAGRASWLLSGLLFLLLPKCPFCVAGWLLIGGVTVSASLAWWLYGSVIAVCLLIWLGIGWVVLRHRTRTATLTLQSLNSESKEHSHERCCCSSSHRQP